MAPPALQSHLEARPSVKNTTVLTSRSVLAMIQRHADKRHALQVLRIETESTACVAFCFHPFKPLLTMVDARGVVRVVNYRPLSSDVKHAVDARAITNRFHVARGALESWTMPRLTCGH